MDRRYLYQCDSSNRAAMGPLVALEYSAEESLDGKDCSDQHPPIGQAGRSVFALDWYSH